MKRIVSIVLALALVFSLAGCMPSDKVYDSGNGLKVTLPGNFKDNNESGDLEGQYALMTLTTGFFSIKEPFADVEGFEDYTLEEYADLVKMVYEENGIKDFKETDGFLSSEFTDTIDGTEFTYFLTVMKGSDAFWQVVFYTTPDRYGKMKPKFDNWLKTVEVQ